MKSLKYIYEIEYIIHYIDIHDIFKVFNSSRKQLVFKMSRIDMKLIGQKYSRIRHRRFAGAS